MIKWLWVINAAIAFIAVTVLVVGFSSLASQRRTLGKAQPGTAESDQSAKAVKNAAQGQIKPTDSPLVAIARKFSKRYAPPPPPPKPKPKPVVVKPKPKPKPKPVVVKPKPKPVVVKPKPKPKPKPPPPKPKPIPKPTVVLEATMAIGEYHGLVWIKLPKSTRSTPFFTGEMVGKYKITKVGDGFINMEREGTTFTLKVPEPKGFDSTEILTFESTKSTKPPASGEK